MDYELAELLLYLKTTTYTNNIYIYCADICISQQNNLKKRPLIKNPIISQYVVNLQNLISRISEAPFHKQPFADVL